MSGQQNTVTAQGRTDPNQNTGISIHNSQVMASSDLKPVLSSFKTYLGRPWMEYSHTVYLQTYLDTLVDPTGYLGSSTSERVKWGGYRVISSAIEASQFMCHLFLACNCVVFDQFICLLLFYYLAFPYYTELRGSHKVCF
ncbi:hypothetical protein CsSME_00029008 [Camellia sinensis var. sinensis]